jgi:hypothetical protein
MQRPDVRIIEPQWEESKEIQSSEWEKQQLLAKYGYSNGPINHQPTPQPQGGLSFEEMCAIEERRLEEERRRRQPQNIPPVYSIDPHRVQYSEQKYSGDGDLGLNIQIVSDMKF